jgi:hypothetical protein
MEGGGMSLSVSCRGSFCASTGDRRDGRNEGEREGGQAYLRVTPLVDQLTHAL